MPRYIPCSNPLAKSTHDQDGHVLKTNEKREWIVWISQVVLAGHCIGACFARQETTRLHLVTI
jgi:hypothetical protein